MMRLRLSILLTLFLFITAFPQAGPDTLRFNKSILPGEHLTLVYKPKSYDASVKRTYPALILLHGWSGGYKDWANNVDLQFYADKYEFLIITPEGYYSSWYLDSPIKENNRMEKFFWDIFYPFIISQYRTVPEKLFISGLSMGGHGAINYFIDNPDAFAGAGSMSGILDLTAFPENWGIKDLLGTFNPKNPAAWLNRSALNRLDKLKFYKEKPLYIECGKKDFAWKVNVAFINKAKALGLRIYTYEDDGNHDWKFWKEGIVRNLDFFSDWLNGRTPEKKD
ncbi:MAG: prolyl oligopeptidase family serine peptidase [Ignavibacteriaceae bacterium]|nr:prolyl oligopeptidase family serine peptidase [Ignavibacteriaceae bacterium]NUM69550.1 prolyl oligopeptidase family serine peptidase [Ignavibacteriaceae bacterium]